MRTATDRILSNVPPSPERNKRANTGDKGRLSQIAGSRAITKLRDTEPFGRRARERCSRHFRTGRGFQTCRLTSGFSPDLNRHVAAYSARNVPIRRRSNVRLVFVKIRDRDRWGVVDHDSRSAAVINKVQHSKSGNLPARVAALLGEG
jgi:hypothetical protein